MSLHPTIRAPKATPPSMQGAHDGVPLVPLPAPLTRLNYFDGKFLRASDLTLEQGYLRHLSHLVALAGGPGVVYGYDVASCNKGTGLRVGSGYALDGLGRPLLLPTEVVLDVDELVELARGAAAHEGHEDLDAGGFAPCVVPPDDEPGKVVASPDWWVLTLSHGEGVCGEEDVYGKLCEAACATDTDRPWRVEGVIARLEPLRLRAPLPHSSAVTFHGGHLRSRLAAAVFGGEARGLSLANGAGLRSAAWCRGGEPVGPTSVPIALVARRGEATAFVDPWTVRRERVDTAPVRWWHPRLGLRPWSVFLAQLLQFQCQLRDAVAFGDTFDPEDPCERSHEAAFEADRFLEDLMTSLDRHEVTLASGQWEQMAKVKQLLAAAVVGGKLRPTSRILINRGIVELPPAGFLPVDPGSSAGVEAQVRAFMGEGVELRFCAARPDVIAQALDQAQHLARISLTDGLDDPRRRPEVDILVPGADEVDASPATPVEHPAMTHDVAVLEAAPMMLAVAPPPALVPRLRARADWVLFVHRSERRCGAVDEPQAPPRDRTFALYTVPVRRPGEAKKLREVLESGTPLDPEAGAVTHEAGPGLLGRRGLIRFAGTSDEMHTADAEVVQMWGPVLPDEAIGAVFVAAHPAVETDTTNVGRADRAVAAVPVTRPPTASTQVLDHFPNVDDPGDLDGVIVVARLITAPAPTPTTCIQVRRIRQNPHNDYWKAREWDGLMKYSELVGTLEIADQQPVSGLDELLHRWSDLGGGTPLRQSSLAYRAGDATAGTADSRYERGHLALKELGYDGAYNKTQFAVEESFQGCATVLFAVVAD